MTYALRGACSPAAHALAAQIARAMALTALVALGLSADPVHEPVHAEAVAFPLPATERNSAEGAVSAERPCITSTAQFGSG
jgi:hypothetical protein